ncbi:hypothetical protein I79_018540 [Cricetulus griseus]|uniref:Uncharacterized protein n=1 Tax=Cricetulus griseus TaxID=10029 RepID=G3I4Z8_CRIGR|nr:hypothetical protein I79_018540 [Cricetulus griseus]
MNEHKPLLSHSLAVCRRRLGADCGPGPWTEQDSGDPRHSSAQAGICEWRAGDTIPPGPARPGAEPEGYPVWTCAPWTWRGLSRQPGRNPVRPCHSPPLLFIEAEDEPRAPVISISLLLLVAAHNREASGSVAAPRIKYFRV